MFWLFAIITGFLMASVAIFWLLTLAFRRHWVWGVVSLLLPVTLIAFSLTHYEQCKQPFWTLLAGSIILSAGLLFR